jgi:hypothetical protein
VQAAQAPSADIETLFLATYGYRGFMDVGQPAAVGTPLGVAYIVPKLRCFSAEVAFTHNISPLYSISLPWIVLLYAKPRYLPHR